jgi:hypothetical protein
VHGPETGDSPRSVLSNVSFANHTVNHPFLSNFTTVRHAPLTAIESPIWQSSRIGAESEIVNVHPPSSRSIAVTVPKCSIYKIIRKKACRMNRRLASPVNIACSKKQARLDHCRHGQNKTSGHHWQPGSQADYLAVLRRYETSSVARVQLTLGILVLPAKTRMGISLAVCAVAVAGIFISDELEKAIPAEKQRTNPQ